MRICVIGAGYVGLVSAVCFAEMGNRVICVEQDAARVAGLADGQVPIYEPGLETMLRAHLASGQLSFTEHLALGVAQAEIVFIAVGTPSGEDGSADLSHVLAVADALGACLQRSCIVVDKSTVPVGTADRVAQVLRERLAERDCADIRFAVVSNPEFLKEGAAIDDFMRPDRIVIGLPPGEEGQQARTLLTRLYAPFNRHHERTLWMDAASAELTKYAANAMLATRISFMNDVARLADALGADVDAVRRGIGSDSRIGHSFLYAGTGYGGSCFPKDTRALVNSAAQHGLRMRVVEATEEVNHHQKDLLARRLIERLGADLQGRRIGVWGLAFKPNTDDMRDAPSRHIVAALLARGAEVRAHDPVAMAEARRALTADLAAAGRVAAFHTPQDGCTRRVPGSLALVDSPLEAVEDADALLVVTEWKCFQNPDWARLASLMRQPLVLDGRNLYEPGLMDELGIEYHGIGRRGRVRLNGRVRPDDRLVSPA